MVVSYCHAWTAATAANVWTNVCSASNGSCSTHDAPTANDSYAANYADKQRPTKLWNRDEVQQMGSKEFPILQKIIFHLC